MSTIRSKNERASDATTVVLCGSTNMHDTGTSLISVRSVVQLYPGPFVRNVRPAITQVTAGRFRSGPCRVRSNVPSNNPELFQPIVELLRDSGFDYLRAVPHLAQMRIDPSQHGLRLVTQLRGTKTPVRSRWAHTPARAPKPATPQLENPWKRRARSVLRSWRSACAGSSAWCPAPASRGPVVVEPGRRPRSR
jgi:hypothetical protein